MIAKAIATRHYEVRIVNGTCFVFTLLFQLNKGVSLKGDFELGNPVRFENDQQLQSVYRIWVFEVYKSKELEK